MSTTPHRREAAELLLNHTVERRRWFGEQRAQAEKVIADQTAWLGVIAEADQELVTQEREFRARLGQVWTGAEGDTPIGDGIRTATDR